MNRVHPLKQEHHIAGYVSLAFAAYLKTEFQIWSGLVGGYQSFEGIFRLHHQERRQCVHPLLPTTHHTRKYQIHNAIKML
jgi:hypothetical protein